MTIDTADYVLHWDSGETFTVMHVRDGRLCWSRYPHGKDFHRAMLAHFAEFEAAAEARRGERA